MRKILLVLVLIGVIFIGYKYFFDKKDTYHNSKYDFSFSYDGLNTTVANGNSWTCGRGNCANFKGSTSFRYSVYTFYEGKLYGGTEVININGEKTNIEFEYKIKNNEIYKTYEYNFLSGSLKKEDIISDSKISGIIEDSKAIPYYTNSLGINFYPTEQNGDLGYCAIKTTETEKVFQICFFNGLSGESSSGENKSLQKVLETFKY